jgi:hypothetical protein
MPKAGTSQILQILSDITIPGISCGYPYAVVWRLSHRYVVEVEMNALDASNFG